MRRVMWQVMCWSGGKLKANQRNWVVCYHKQIVCLVHFASQFLAVPWAPSTAVESNISRDLRRISSFVCLVPVFLWEAKRRPMSWGCAECEDIGVNLRWFNFDFGEKWIRLYPSVGDRYDATGWSWPTRTNYWPYRMSVPPTENERPLPPKKCKLKLIQ